MLDKNLLNWWCDEKKQNYLNGMYKNLECLMEGKNVTILEKVALIIHEYVYKKE